MGYDKEYYRRYRKKNAVALKENARQYYLATRDGQLAKKRAKWAKQKREDPAAHKAFLKKNNDRYYANRKVILKRQKAYNAKHREHILKRQKSWWIKNRERERKKLRDRYWRNPNFWRKRQRKIFNKSRDQIVAKMREKYRADPDKHREQKRRDYEIHKTVRAEGMKRWRRENPGKCLALSNKHRALKRKAAIGTDRIAYANFVQSVRMSTRFTCHYCKRNVAKWLRTIDHVIPLSRGGKDCITNIVCACWRCNSRKHNKMPDEFSRYLELNGI